MTGTAFAVSKEDIAQRFTVHQCATLDCRRGLEEHPVNVSLLDHRLKGKEATKIPKNTDAVDATVIAEQSTASYTVATMAGSVAEGLMQEAPRATGCLRRLYVREISYRAIRTQGLCRPPLAITCLSVHRADLAHQPSVLFTEDKPSV